MLEAYNAAGGKGSQAPRPGDGAKLLRAPEVFDTDDPVNYTNWRGQILNWLTFCEGRLADLIKDVEQLGTMTKMSTLETQVQDRNKAVLNLVIVLARTCATNCSSSW